MTKLLTLKKMKKKLVLLTLILVTLLLSGCGLFSKHEHEYRWFDGEDYKTAYQKCTICDEALDQSSLYQDPIYIRTQMLGDPDEGYLFYYEINVGSGKYNIGDEVEITISLKPDLPGYCKEGEFRIKIADSPYYEIVGDSEYVVSDFAKADFDLTKLLNFKFTIRPTSTCDLRERLNFKIKFNPTDYFEREAKYFTNNTIHYFYCDFSEEYFFTIGHIEYVIDSQGMLLGTRDNPPFYDSLNREYLAGAIDKDSYIDKFINYLAGGATIIYYDYNNAFHYLSGNIRAKITINDEYSHLIGQYHSSEEENLHEIARDLLKIMLDNNAISSEMYETELHHLESVELKSKIKPTPLYSLVPFDDYFRAHYFDFVVDVK